MNKETESKHTPTPWESGKDWGHNAGDIVKVYKDQPIKIICHVYADNESLQDVSLIVRAVNAQEELLKALKFARSHTENNCGCGGSSHEKDCLQIELEKVLGKAIAKAEAL